jgi:hypothetical protein
VPYPGVSRTPGLRPAVGDLYSGDPVFAGDGKAGTALKPLWELLGGRRGRIEAEAIDMSPAFMKPVRGNLPDAAVTLDHFHVVRLMSTSSGSWTAAMAG